MRPTGANNSLMSCDASGLNTSSDIRDSNGHNDDDYSGAASISGDGSAENDYKTSRAAVQYAVAWEFEMWRRAEKARFESVLEKKQVAKMAELEDEFVKKHKTLAEKFEAKRAELMRLQEQLRTTLEACDKEKRKLESEKKLLERTREKLKKDYNDKVRDCDMLVNAARNECAQREAATEARAQSLKREVEFWKEQFNKSQEELKRKETIIQEQLRAATSSPESVLRAQLTQRESDLAQAKIDLQQRTNDLERIKGQLDHALRLLEDTREEARRFKNAAEAAEATAGAKEKMETEMRRYKEGKKKWSSAGQELQQVKQLLPSLRGAVCGEKEKLIKERHDLLMNGLYSEDDELIRGLDERIAMCYD